MQLILYEINYVAYQSQSTPSKGNHNMSSKPNKDNSVSN